MTSYTLGIGGTVPPVCWLKPVGDEYAVFCNSPRGYEIAARDAGGKIERVIMAGDGPVNTTMDLASLLVDGETILTIRAR